MELTPVEAVYDEMSKGRKLRFIIGNVKSPVSGALYLSSEIELHTEVTITFPIPKKKKKEDKK